MTAGSGATASGQRQPPAVGIAPSLNPQELRVLLQLTAPDLLERILDRVESIDKNVEDLLDRIGGSYGDFLDRTGYNEQDRDETYR